MREHVYYAAAAERVRIGVTWDTASTLSWVEETLGEPPELLALAPGGPPTLQLLQARYSHLPAYRGFYEDRSELRADATTAAWVAEVAGDYDQARAELYDALARSAQLSTPGDNPGDKGWGEPGDEPGDGLGTPEFSPLDPQGVGTAEPPSDLGEGGVIPTGDVPTTTGFVHQRGSYTADPQPEPERCGSCGAWRPARGECWLCSRSEAS